MKNPRLIVAGLALAALGILPGCKKPPPPPRPLPTATPTPLPASDRIGFTRAGRLFTVALNGSGSQQIFSRRDQSVWFPCASKTGAHFLAWVSKPDGTQNIARIQADGSKVEYLTAIDEKARPEMKNIRLGNAPAYNSKGDKIAYSFNGDIWIMDADGYNAVTLIADHCSWSPSWSPDDKQIAYVNGQEGKNFNIWVTNVADRDTYQVTDFEDFWVGRPRWNANGKSLFFTRVDKESSLIAQVPSSVSQPLVDSSPIIKDDRSADVEFSPQGGLKMVYSVAKDNPFEWKLWIANADGGQAAPLIQDQGYSPAWLHPTVPLPSLAEALPTPVPTRQPTVPLPKPAPAGLQVAAKPVPVAPRPAPTAAAQAAVPAFGDRSPAARQPEIAVPTQPPVQAAPLRVSLQVRFEDGSDQISLQSLPDITKVAARISQYKEGRIRIRGPLDNSALDGKFPSALERSRARAVAVRQSIAAQLGTSEANIEAVPFTPSMLGASEGVNGLQVLIQLK